MPSKAFCKNILLLSTLLLGATHGFCNWGSDGSAATSVCEGGAQGGEWCNTGEDNCESGCDGNWCSPPASDAGFCNWGSDGSAATSVCEGGAQGGDWCNDNEDNCESGCDGNWCGIDTTCPSGYTEASWTSYTSYAACCEDGENYDPTADTTECEFYNACAYKGDFAYIEHQTYDEVKNKNLVAFFSTHGDNSNYGNKQIRVLLPSGQTVDALVADTCGDSDCDGCCTSNAQPSGYLVDMEYWTVVKNFGPDADASGQVCWKVV
jgi:hypothetical protein